MNRHRDHLAPSNLTDDQLEGIRNLDQIRSLRTRRLTLKNDMRALHGTLKKAKHAEPDRYGEHEAVVKVGHILMRFGRIDSRMLRKLWSQLQRDLTFS
jgi:hypothetical protein